MTILHELAKEDGQAVAISVIGSSVVELSSYSGDKNVSRRGNRDRQMESDMAALKLHPRGDAETSNGSSKKYRRAIRDAFRHGFVPREEGSTLLEVALIVPFLLLLLVGAVDFGRGYYVSIEVSSAAEAGAMYGMLNPTNLSGMQTAARFDAQDVPIMTAAATSGCECSDGTSAVSGCSNAPSGCSSNAVNYVEVDTVANYTPILTYPGIPSTLTLKGSSRMRASY